MNATAKKNIVTLRRIDGLSGGFRRRKAEWYVSGDAPRTPDLPPKMLAAEIAAGRIKARIGMVQVDPADHASGNSSAFQPSAWKAPAWRPKIKGQRSPKEYVCDDPMEQALAVAVTAHGFNLPKFDMRLDKQPPGNLRDFMVIHRHALWEAIATEDHVATLFRLHEMAKWQALDRDTKLQTGVHQKRRLEVMAWIDKQLAADAGVKAPELWSRAPRWITDQVGQRRFAARVTACRKRRARK